MPVEYASTADWIGAIAQVIAALVTLWVVILTYKSFKMSLMSESLRVFNHYSDKYDYLKKNIRTENLKSNGDHSLVVRDNFTIDEFRAIQDLWKLFDREHLLMSKKLVSKDVSEIWLKGIKKNYSIPSLRWVWLQRSNTNLSFEVSPRFAKWVENEFRNLGAD